MSHIFCCQLKKKKKNTTYQTLRELILACSPETEAKAEAAAAAAGAAAATAAYYSLTMAQVCMYKEDFN